MKGQAFKRFLTLFALALLPAGCLSVNENNGLALVNSNSVKNKIGSDQVNDVTGVTTDPTQYVGYGFNVAGGKALYEPDALMLNNPILDVDNQVINSHIKVFDGSKTEYQSEASASAKSIAKKYGQTIGAGLGGGGSIGCVNVDIDAKFNMGQTSAWGSVSNEEFSYYTIFAGNRPVILQMEHSDLSNYLSPTFKRDLYAVNDTLSAENLFKKYGTHLLTGYTLGGIFEMTNYYATKSKNYQREQTIGFDAQVGMALGSFGSGNLDFSFTNNFGYKDNNKQATNQYKCTTYGGLTFPGLTIDQAFSWYETITGAGFVYQLWTDSINAGKNLVIVNVPQSSKMVPLWDLLPVSREFAANKECLMTAFDKMSKDAYGKYENKYPDRFVTGLGNSANFKDTVEFEDYGFDYSTAVDQVPARSGLTRRYITSFVSSEDVPSTEKFIVNPDSVLSMSYANIDLVGQQVEWTLNNHAGAGHTGSNLVNLVDNRHGIVQIGAIDASELTSSFDFDLSLNVNGVNVFKRTFTVSPGVFCGGDGSENSPYLIATGEQFEKYMGDPAYWKTDVHAKLIKDISLNHSTADLIGTENNPFDGTFDGCGHTITVNTVEVESTTRTVSLFGKNQGTINNLTVDYQNKVANLSISHSMISGLVCVNEVSGVISNCIVKGFNINYKNYISSSYYPVYEAFKDYPNAVYAAGLACVSKGLIKNCKVDNMTAIVDISAKESEVKNIYVGGVCSVTLSEFGQWSTIENTESTGFSGYVSSIKCQARDLNELFLSAFVGSAKKTNIRSCLVKDVDKDNGITDAGNSASYGLSYDLPSNGGAKVKRFLGGLIGSIGNAGKEGDVYIEDTIVLGLGKDLIKNVTSDKKGIGVLIGRDHLASGAKLVINNSYCETTGETQTVRNYIIGCDVDDSGGSNRFQVRDKYPQLSISTTFTKSNYSSNIRNNEEEWTFAGDTPSVALNQIVKDSIYLDTSKVKTTFYYSSDYQESFSTAGLCVRGYYANGTEFVDDNVITNPDDFERQMRISKVMGVDNDATISCEYLGVQFTYTVHIRKQFVTRIYAIGVAEPTIQKSYEGHDSIVTDNIEVHAVMNTGIDIVVPFKSSEEVDGYTYSINGGTLVLGNNDINIEYQGLECVYHLDAEKRNITKIEVTTVTEGNSDYEFNVGTTNINFDDLSVLVTYDNGDKVTVKGSECDFVYSRIQENENTITVIYDVENSTTFKVKGVYKANQEDVNLFVSLVNEHLVEGLDGLIKYDSYSMKERFEVLSKISAVLDRIGYEYEGLEGSEFNTAKATFIQYRNAYDSLAANINKGYADAIEVSGSLMHPVLTTGAGFVSLAAILSWILKRI